MTMDSEWQLAFDFSSTRTWLLELSVWDLVADIICDREFATLHVHSCTAIHWNLAPPIHSPYG